MYAIIKNDIGTYNLLIKIIIITIIIKLNYIRFIIFNTYYNLTITKKILSVL